MNEELQALPRPPIEILLLTADDELPNGASMHNDVSAPIVADGDEMVSTLGQNGPDNSENTDTVVREDPTPNGPRKRMDSRRQRRSILQEGYPIGSDVELTSAS